MSSTVLCVVVLVACSLAFGSAQTSCKGRCGNEYYRGNMCQCDYTCLSYEECCNDFESQCTTKNSCKGRCGESFKRGRLCSCDSDCDRFKQCCPDHKMHCDAEEPTLNDATEPPTFSEGNNADSQIFPNDEFSNDGVEDPEVNPIPESTSGYGLTTADLLDQISIEPTQNPDPLEFSTVFSQTTVSDNENTQADDSPSTLYATESPDATDAIQLIRRRNNSPSAHNSSSGLQPAFSNLIAPNGVFSLNQTPEVEPAGEAEVQPEDDMFPTDPTVASSDEPEVTTLPDTASYTPVASVSTGPTQDSSTVLVNSQGTTISASTLDVTHIPEATASNLGPENTENTDNATTSPPSSLADHEDPSTSVSPAGPGDVPELDALTTLVPSVTDAVQDDRTDVTTAGVTTDDLLNVTPDPTKHAPFEATSKPQDKPDPYTPSPTKPTLAKPNSKPDKKPLDPVQTLNINDDKDYQADDSNDTNLCSGRPVSAVTTLSNGTMVAFRGHHFWILDRYMVPGPAQSITQVWGVPSPIDTVFTRCNCQGKTYIFKGSQYWRYENAMLDQNYPKVIQTGFDGLRGHITAALSVPQYQKRRESVYFFKRGGSVQKYSYQFGTSTTCGRKAHNPVYPVHKRIVRQAVSLLGPAINIRTSWRGFPSSITAAVSIPTIPTIIEPERYKYYVFSRSTSYKVRMDMERPVVPAPTANESPQSNDFFKCQKKV
ncbi:LOW QUALITY PROTEIN: proteoglycan 4b [Cottoperca gobio]|uniref:LOW QUALITY PROTEIN: proteoglycan 4b n=1 Tax=Cottoperca gobio TaxID=56716 RepID=A0A6J2PIQ9_COTGO|nr:LOW QUALITY PROTEIN: proteoglycan 4 [Cottoperca gobio]